MWFSFIFACSSNNGVRLRCSSAYLCLLIVVYHTVYPNHLSNADMNVTNMYKPIQDNAADAARLWCRVRC